MAAAVPGRRSAAGFEAAFGRQPEMMALFVELFGPYPFAAYTVVVTDDELEIPLEAQGLSTFGAQLPAATTGTRCGWSPTSWPTSGSATA